MEHLTEWTFEGSSEPSAGSLGTDGIHNRYQRGIYVSI